MGLDVGIGTGTEALMSAANPLPQYPPDNVASGTITATDTVVGTHSGLGTILTGTPTAGSYVAFPLTGGEAGFTLRLSGTFGGGTVWIESSVDSTNGVDGGWTTNLMRQSGVDITFIDASITSAGIFRGTAAGYAYIRVRSTGATTPSVTAAFRASRGPSVTALVASLPAGSNLIGNVGVNPAATGTTVAPVAGTAAAQTPPASGGTGVVNLTLTAVTAAASLIAAPGAGLSIYVTDMEGSNSGATGTLISFYEGTTGLRYARFMAASGGGFVTNLKTPWKLPANTAVGYSMSAATTSAYLSLNYFVAP